MAVREKFESSQVTEIHRVTNSESRPLRVLLVGNYALDRQESMHRFAALMQDGLRQAGHHAEILRPPVLMGKLKSGHHGLGKWLAYVDKFFFFPGRLRAEARQADVIHICDHGYAMFAGCAGETPSVVTCHDMLAVRGAMGEETDIYPSPTGHVLQRWIVRGMRRSKAIVSDSSATASDVQRIVGGTPKKKVILLSLNHSYRKLPREEALARLTHLTELDTAKPYVLHVGHNHPRKNRPCVIRAFAQASRELDLQLVLAGPPLTQELIELIDAEGISGRVKVIVKPDNEVLEALYNLALVFFFPSRYEGFGWPLIEAQACGCPVICSYCAPFAEIVAESAIRRDHSDERGFAEDILRLARDDGERRAWSEAGLRNVQRFNPEPMIAQYVDVYRELARKDTPKQERARYAGVAAAMKKFLCLAVLMFPWRIRRLLLVRLLRYDIHPTARIGWSWVCPDRLEMAAGSRIGHLTVCKGLSLLKMGEQAQVGNLNWITGFPLGNTASFSEDNGRRAELVLAEHSAVTHRHLIDCTNAVRIGRFSTVAGYRSQVLTHSIDLESSRQASKPITIGEYCFVGTNCVLLGGSVLPDYSVLGASSVLNKAHAEPHWLYAGNPAQPVKPLSEQMRYFQRSAGFVS